MVNIILSPYFNVNTKLVTSFCQKCYLEEEKEDTFITAVNTRFLKIYDPKQYQIVVNNFFLVPRIKFESACLKEKEEYSIENKHSTVLQINQKFYRYRKLIKMKQSIMRKYSKFNYDRKHMNNIQRSQKSIGFRTIYKSNDNSKKRQEKKCSIKIAVCIPKIKEESTHEQLVDQSFKQEQHTNPNVPNGTKIKMELKYEEDEKLKKKKDQIHCPKLEKTEFGEEKPKWIPPISPHNLIEEKYYNDPWALLVVTIFLNRTSCILALPYMDKFFEDFKGPYDVLKVEVSSLVPYFTKIGLIKTRATQIWRMSHDFVHKDWNNVGELYGVGKYAEDAYRMFHLGDFSVQPTDRYLKIYKAWYEMTQRNEKLGIYESNSQVYLEDYFVAPEDEDRTEDDGKEEVK